MYNQLLIQAFEKAGEEIHSEVLSRQAAHLSDVILENSGMPYGERSLRDRYKEVNNHLNINLNLYVADALSQYLGYQNFNAYLASTQEQSNPKTSGIKTIFKRYKYLLLVFVGVLVLTSVYLTTRSRWMVWETDHYKEVSFDEQLLQNGRLKIYNKDRIHNFKKTTADCNTTFVFNGGNTQLWYGKNKMGELELFTSPGLHPETGKTLKELTKYMYDKYICIQ
jgi:hypothetical protein